METCVLLAARSYDFTDDTGKNVKGVTLTYLTGDVEVSGERRGAFPMTINAPSEIATSLSTLPGVYDLDFKQRPGPKGRPVLQVVGVKFKAALDGMFKPAPAAAPQGS
jgi:hypothetical protein